MFGRGINRLSCGPRRLCLWMVLTLANLSDRYSGTRLFTLLNIRDFAFKYNMKYKRILLYLLLQAVNGSKKSFITYISDIVACKSSALCYRAPFFLKRSS